MSESKTTKKLKTNIVTIVILAVFLCITTFALVYSTVAVDNHLFQTGEIKINLNDGKPVIEEHEFLFEPGVTVEKEFYLENQSTWDVYYRLYLDKVEGALAEVLDVTIRDGAIVLFNGKAVDLTKDQVGAADDILKLNERKALTIVFHFPKEAGNSTQNLYLSFDLKADAVQTKNNPNKRFD